MPYVNCRIMEGVLDEDQKAELAEQITEAFARVVGEPVRRLTWVVIDDLSTGHLTIGGRPVTAPAAPV
jgi:4-oxalocrotonate tautomerase